MNRVITRLPMPQYFLLSADNHHLHLQKSLRNERVFGLHWTVPSHGHFHAQLLDRIASLFMQRFCDHYVILKWGFDMQILSAHTQDEWHRN
jgi:hypothetical protein